MNSRDYYCPKCGGWLEMLDQDEFGCDTCDYIIDSRPKLTLEKNKKKEEGKEYGIQ